ncbi:Hpt domain-containing protein [Thalassovita mangrovi]|uniref:HPt domain-containing protein n=1 Tax=Thalassovita mangrovi TaxID=2692236 RepID=A0A6L8LN21_9RHOB|nr:Hpt domain-containing protein [Thalassovita mangrovi]MYM57441.1 hypothetical protein [Thalassovita mangrovi]
MTAFQDKLRGLIALHCASLREEVQDLREVLARLRPPAGEAGGAISEGAGLVHKIKGSSGSIGFHEVGAVAQELETLLRGLERAGGTPDAGGIARALALVSELDALVAELRPEQSALYHAG